MASLAELLIPLSVDDARATQLALLALGNFPATSWQPGSTPRTMVEADAETLADLSATIPLIANGGYLETCPEGPWLELLARSAYGIEPKAAVGTRGIIVLTDQGGGGPYTIAVEQLWVGPPGGKFRFRNTTGGTLAKFGALPLEWQAEAAGGAYNLPNGAITSLLTPLPGVAVSNPDPGTGTWITSQGADAESGASIKVRCKARWPSLGSGATSLVYEGWALTAAPAITRVNVLESTPLGQVTIYLAGPSAAASADDVTAVAAFIAPRRPLCVQVNCFPAVNAAQAITGTVYVRQAALATAQAAFATAMAAYQSTLPVGAAIYVARLIDLVMSTAGVTNVANLQINGAAADVQLADSQVATFTISGLNWIAI